MSQIKVKYPCWVKNVKILVKINENAYLCKSQTSGLTGFDSV